MLPGPASGEGCSLEGGCAACPYMKMNTLAALFSVCDRCGSAAGDAMLEGYRPRPYVERIGDKTVAQVRGAQAHATRISRWRLCMLYGAGMWLLPASAEEIFCTKWWHG